MKLTILPEKKKRIKAISQASKELNYKVFLADKNDAVLMAAFAFEHEANEYVTRQSELVKADYTVVYTPNKPEESELKHNTKSNKLISNLTFGKFGKGLTLQKLETVEEPAED